MAALPDEDRHALWAAFMAAESGTRSHIGVTKHDLRDAVDAVDQWVDDNAASFNQAIPQPARSALTAKQKGMILTYVVGRRTEVG